MNKILFLALFAISAIMSACGSQDGSPAKLKNNQAGYISPFDTLVAEFDSKIVNINEEAMKDKISSSAIFTLLPPADQKANSKLFLIGDYRTTLGGLSYFEPKNRTDSIVFENLENTDGYVLKREVLYFQVEPLLDDISGANDTTETAVNLDPFLTNTVQTITFAGVLDHKIAASKFNMEDYYKISLKLDDKLKVSVKFKDSLSISLIEPGKNSIDTTVLAKDLEYTVLGGKHLDEDDSKNKEVYFYIIISDNNSSNPPNPYTLTISRLRE